MTSAIASKSEACRFRARRYFAHWPVLGLFLVSPAWAQNGPVSMVSSADNRFEFFLPWSSGVRHFWQNANGSWTVDGAIYAPKPAMINDVSDFDAHFTGYRQTTASARDVNGRLMVAWIANGRVYVATAPGAGASLTPTGTQVGGFTTAWLAGHRPERRRPAGALRPVQAGLPVVLPSGGPRRVVVGL